MKVLNSTSRPELLGNLHFPGSGNYYVEVCEGVEAKISIKEAKFLFEKLLYTDNLYLYRDNENVYVFRSK